MDDKLKRGAVPHSKYRITSTYYHLFWHLEQICLLDALDDTHLFGLHYVYIPIINHHLEEW